MSPKTLVGGRADNHRLQLHYALGFLAQPFHHTSTRIWQLLCPTICARACGQSPSKTASPSLYVFIIIALVRAMIAFASAYALVSCRQARPSSQPSLQMTLNNSAPTRERSSSFHFHPPPQTWSASSSTRRLREARPHCDPKLSPTVRRAGQHDGSPAGGAVSARMCP